MIRAGLRIDVDTLRGTRTGVPNLIRVLARRGVRATFFFSVGPDNMGRHLWRLVRPSFLGKMLRTRAPRLYGWDILLQGTLWPGTVIGDRRPEPIRLAAGNGHEIGLHAWDHHLWQRRVECMDRGALLGQIQKGYRKLSDILGKPPACFAAPAWRVTPEALRVLDRFPFQYQSDCRGRTCFRPVIRDERLSHVQVPTTLPTYDELVGRWCGPDTYNETLHSMIRPDRLNVLTIHAEVEGISGLSAFEHFLARAEKRRIVFEPLGALASTAPDIAESGVRRSSVDGRDGWVACQE